jgi:cyclophilin family peptidyl-prolyl cis-trans isomerase
MTHRMITTTVLLVAIVGAAQADQGADAAAKPADAAKEPAKAAAATKEPAAKAAAAQATAGGQVAVLETAQGTIVIKFHEKDAPKTVANFKKLVQSKFYDGTYFHRVIPGFMIQGGDPNTKNADPNDDGTGGPGYTVPAEIKLPHLRGSVATARQGDQVNPKKDSSGSQFFICVAPQPSLDRGGYTVFGEVIAGMDAVDKIVALAKDPTVTQGQAGPNPMKKALVTKATLEPLSKYEKPAAAK